ncbi:protein translocase subunit SecD [Patescibacteria group bacterium]|jgi:protein-export membrane protein SecD|nr:protein translocase subunit SecD [Patescibacteria group bacterium]
MAKAVSTTLTRTSLQRRVAGLFVLALVVGSIAYPPPANTAINFLNQTFGTHLPNVSKDFVLGLDLQGGTRLEYEADVKNINEGDRSAAVEGARDVIERRVNSIGVSEPLVTTVRVGEDYRIAAELAGVRDVNQAIKLIGETPILEFKEQNTDPARELTAEEKKKLEEDNAAAKKTAEEVLAKAKEDPNGFEALVKEKSTDAATKALGGDLGFIKSNPAYAPLYEDLKMEPAGVVNRLIEVADNFMVVKIEETKDAGPEILASHILIQWGGSTGASASTTASKEEAKKLIDEIKAKATVENFADLAKQYSMEPGASESGGDLGWFGKGIMVKEFEEPAFNATKGQISDVIETPFGYHLMFKKDERTAQDIRVRAAFFRKTVETDIVPVDQWKNTELTGKHLERAVIDFDQTGTPQISLQFDGEGADLFAEITKRNIGQPVAIFLDGEALSIPTVQNEIVGGQAVITGTFTITEAKLLAQRLQAGALPVPINLIAQNTVGPTLGADSLNKSLEAGVIGFILVAIFAILLYRVPGVSAVIVLVLYAGLNAALYKLAPITLTLSGIAGFILSIGMAIDSNVLVFERLKEELESGKDLSRAMEEAFKRAWTSIRDGHVTILISSAVLFWFSSSMIKGFAFTLALGTLISLFTATVTTRTVLRLLVRSPLSKWPWLFLAKRK